MSNVIYRVVVFGYRDKDKLYGGELFGRVFDEEIDARSFANKIVQVGSEGSIYGTVTGCHIQTLRIESFEEIIKTEVEPSKFTPRQILDALPPRLEPLNQSDSINEINTLQQATRNKLQELLLKPEDFGPPLTTTRELDVHTSRGNIKILNKKIPGYPTYAELLTSPDPVRLLADYAAKRAGKITQLPGTRPLKQDASEQSDFDPDSPSCA